ncbi:MAG TPA: PadR family transcriptional regulator [Nitriliruptorales bacterium]|nr:PadR family transcriptional regulator [Nitriliruptorales bacterium]
MTAEDPLLGMPRNFLRPCVLLLLGEAPSHGYDLLEQLRALGLEHVDPGGLYRGMRAMEQEGLVRSSWEPSDAGPPRRTYELTDEGREWLHAWAGALRDVRRMLGRFLDRYEALSDLAGSRPGARR